MSKKSREKKQKAENARIEPQSGKAIAEPAEESRAGRKANGEKPDGADG